MDAHRVDAQDQGQRQRAELGLAAVPAKIYGRVTGNYLRVSKFQIIARITLPGSVLAFESIP